MESKDDVKRRIGRSPDRADALCLAVASPKSVNAVPAPAAASIVPAAFMANGRTRTSWGRDAALRGADVYGTGEKPKSVQEQMREQGILPGQGGVQPNRYGSGRPS